MPSNPGFTKTQLKQLKSLFTQERQYTESLLAQEIAKLKRSLIRVIGKNKNELQQSIATLAIQSPTRKEFEKLKVKVDYYHPNSSI